MTATIPNTPTTTGNTMTLRNHWITTPIDMLDRFVEDRTDDEAVHRIIAAYRASFTRSPIDGDPTNASHVAQGVNAGLRLALMHLAQRYDYDLAYDPAWRQGDVGASVR